MSLPEVPHTPAWSGLMPGNENYHLLTGPWANTLLLAIGKPGRIYQRQGERVCREGFYQYVPADGTSKLFLKVIKNNRVTGQLNSDKIARWLRAHHIPVSCILPSYPRRINHEFSLLGYIRLDGRICQCDEAQELNAVAQLIAKTHRALSAYPKSDLVKQKSAERDVGFAEFQANFQDGFDAATNQFIKATPVDLPKEHAQVLHGDLNLGNIWVVKNKTFTLLDFEDSLHNYHSPCVDIAMLIERFILIHGIKDQDKISAAKAMIKAYESKLGAKLEWHKSLAEILRSLSVRALLLINRAQNEKFQQPLDSEIEKFKHLYQFTLDKQSMLDTIQGDG